MNFLYCSLNIYYSWLFFSAASLNVAIIKSFLKIIMFIIIEMKCLYRNQILFFLLFYLNVALKHQVSVD